MIDPKNTAHTYGVGVLVGVVGGLIIGFGIAGALASSSLSDLHIKLIESGFATWVVDYKTGNTTFSLLTPDQYTSSSQRPRPEEASNTVQPPSDRARAGENPAGGSIPKPSTESGER